MAQSAWLTGYLQASFRGVEFFIRRAENEGGRRISTHTYPERDDVDHEDLGRAERKFSFSAYIVADDYFQQRENLITALEKKGVGRLVHPYRGLFDVVVLDWKASETTDEGRMVRFDLNFAEQKQVQLTIAVNNTQAEVLQKKDDYVQAILDDFQEVYNLAQQPVSAVQDALAAINRGLDVVDAAKAVVGSAAEFQRELSNVRGKVISLALSAESLSNSLLGLVDFGTDSRDTLFPATPENSVEQFQEMNAILSAMVEPATDTPVDIYQQPDYPARQVQNLIGFFTLSSAAGLITEIEFETVEGAEDLRLSFFETLDQINEAPATSDEIFEAVRDIKAAVSQDLDRRILDLSTVVDFTTVSQVNTLELSNTIYGTIDREQEIINRNQILHPGFIPAAQTLRVQIDGR